MGFLSQVLGTNNDFKVDQSQFSTPVNGNILASHGANTYGQGQNALAQQNAFAQALQAQGGIGNQANVFAQQQALANQLGQQAQGQGPNPALAQLAQTTGQNAQNQAALMASQRGAGANAGLLARQAAMQGGALQQQATGQAAVLRAQQQLAAQNALQQQQAQMAGLATNQVGQQANALSGANQFAQGQQGLAQNAINSQNQNQLGINQINAGVAAGNQQSSNALIGGLIGAGGAALSAGMMPQKASHGGMIQGYAEGGDVGHLQWTGGSQEEQAQRASQMQSAFNKPIENPIAKAMNWLSGGPQSATGQRVASGMKEGGKVPGEASVNGDSYSNDTVPAMLSPGEVVIPRHVMQSDDPVKGAAEFVKQVMSKKKVEPKSRFEDGGAVANPEDSAPTNEDLEKYLPNDSGQPQAQIAPDLAAAIKQPVNPEQYQSMTESSQPQEEGPAPASIPQPTMPQSKGLGQVEKGLKLEAGVQGGLGEQEADIANEQRGQLEQANKQYQEQLKPVQEQRQALMTDYQNGHVDAGRLWHSMSTGQKIGTAIGLMLGGIGAGLTHQENAAAKYLNQAIENDVKSQEIDLGKKRSLLDDNLREMGNIRDARIMTIGNARDIAGLKMQEAVANAKDPMAKARLQQELGKWQMQTDQMMYPLQMKEAVKNALGSGKVDPATAVPVLVPKEHQAKAFEEIGRAENIKKNKDSILKAFDQAAEEYKLNPFAKRSGVKMFHQMLLPNFKAIDGTVRQAAMDETFDNLTPQKFDSAKTIADKRAATVNWMNSESAAPTARGYGIDVNKADPQSQAIINRAKQRLQMNPNDQAAAIALKKYGG